MGVCVNNYGKNQPLFTIYSLISVTIEYTKTFVFLLISDSQYKFRCAMTPISRMV